MGYSSLISYIQSRVYENDSQSISGTGLQEALLQMVASLGDGYQFKGVATPATNPGTPDQKVFYIASEVGTYSNFGLSVGENEVAVFLWNGSWSKQSTGAASAEVVNQLGQEIYKIKIVHKPIDIQTTDNGHWIKDNGTLSGSPTYSIDYYSIPGDYTQLVFNAKFSASAGVHVVHYFNGNTHIGYEYPTVLDIDNYSGVLTIPAGATKIGINRNANDSTELFDVFEYDGNISNDILVLKEKTTVLDNILSGQFQIPISSSVDNKFLKNDGTLGSATGYYIKSYEISDLTKEYHFKSTIAGDGINVVHYFNGETHLGYEYPVTSGTTEYSGVLHIPAGTTKITLNTQSGFELYTIGLYDGSLPDKVLDNTRRIEALEDINSDNNNYVVLGDSITWLGGNNCDDADGWTKWFKDKIKPKSIKSYAWSGATWTNTPNTVSTDVELNSLNDNNTIWQQIRRLIADVNNEVQVAPDVVIIAAGVNDVIAKHYTASGESSPSDHRPNLLDKTAAQAFSEQSTYITSASVQTIVTLADSIRYGCEMLIQAFPSVQIILMTPLQTSRLTFATTYADNQTTLGSVRQIIKDCAAYLSLNVIEQDKVCGVYYTQEKVGHYNLYDGLHTSETGAKKIGSIVASIVKAMII